MIVVEAVDATKSATARWTYDFLEPVADLTEGRADAGVIRSRGR